MRPWLVGLIVFAGAYAGASLAGVPWLCRNPQYAEMLGFVRACARPGGLPASAMALVYFASVATGLLAAIISERFRKPAPKKEVTVPAVDQKAAVAAIEEILPQETAALAVASAPVAAPVSTPPVAHPSALTPAPVTPAVEPAKPAPASTIKVAPAVAAPPRPAPPAMPPPAPKAAPVIPPPVQKPSVQKPSAPPGSIPNYHDDAEFLKKIWGLDAMDSAAAAELGARYVDESMLSAIHFGTDPKMHLSKLAQLMLQQDPDLKSHGVRGVVKHIALRLRELGVTPGSAPGA